MPAVNEPGFLLHRKHQPKCVDGLRGTTWREIRKTLDHKMDCVNGGSALQNSQELLDEPVVRKRSVLRCKPPPERAQFLAVRVRRGSESLKTPTPELA